MKYRVLLSLLIVVSFCFSACGTLTKPDESKPVQVDQDAPTATPIPKTDAQEQPTVTPKPAEGTGDSGPRGQAGGWGDLKSYRLYARQTEQESGEVSEMTAECVLDPFALHTSTQSGDGSMEMIAVDNVMWGRFADQGWHKTDFDPDEIAGLEKELEQEVGELPDIPSWPQDLFYLPGQVGLPLVEGGLTRIGTETVNGVSCTKYEVESDYRYGMDLGEVVGWVTTTVRATGTIWVADQDGLPRIVMQADVYETEAVTTPAGENTSTMRIEHQVTEINVPITITPPEGAVEMGVGMPGMDDLTDDQDDEGTPNVTLDDLDSYRLEWSVTLKQEGYETTMIYLIEWIKEPFTHHLVVDMGEIAFEHLWAGDKVWTKPAGSSDWIEISSDEAPDPLEGLGGVMDWEDSMTPDGEETIDGIHCECYTTELTMPQATGSHRVCVAAQAGIPPLVIHGLMQIEQQGMTTITESNLYDINQPFTIETPE